MAPNLTQFTFDNREITIPASLPESVYYEVAMTLSLLDYLNEKFDESFSRFSLPPGRSSVFKGIKNTTLVDSSYNANLGSMIEILNMFNHLPGKIKWAVISDMLEQGSEEREEHEKLVHEIAQYDFDRVILMGPRARQYTYPILKDLIVAKTPLDVFDKPKEVLDFLEQNINGGETILFKGGRFLEGVIEHFLADKNDVEKLCRREIVWVKARKKVDL